MGNHPFLDASEIEVTGRDTGRIVLAAGYGSHGEAVRRIRNKAGRVVEMRLGSGRGSSQGRVIADLSRRYGKRPRAR
jgi:hypothetical protein